MELDEKTAFVIIEGFETEFHDDILIKLEERKTNLCLSEDNTELLTSEIISNLENILKWISIKLTTEWSVPLLFNLCEVLRNRDELTMIKNFIIPKIQMLTSQNLDQNQSLSSLLLVGWYVRSLIYDADISITLILIGDKRLVSPQSISALLSILDQVQRGMETLFTDIPLKDREDVTWLILNGILLILKVSLPLSNLGFSREVIPYQSWALLCLENSTSLSSSNYLQLRTRVYLSLFEAHMRCKDYEGCERVLDRGEGAIKERWDEERMDLPIPPHTLHSLTLATQDLHILRGVLLAYTSPQTLSDGMSGLEEVMGEYLVGVMKECDGMEGDTILTHSDTQTISHLSFLAELLQYSPSHPLLFYHPKPSEREWWGAFSSPILSLVEEVLVSSSSIQEEEEEDQMNASNGSTLLQKHAKLGIGDKEHPSTLLTILKEAFKHSRWTLFDALTSILWDMEYGDKPHDQDQEEGVLHSSNESDGYIHPTLKFALIWNPSNNMKSTTPEEEERCYVLCEVHLLAQSSLLLRISSSPSPLEDLSWMVSQSTSPPSPPTSHHSIEEEEKEEKEEEEEKEEKEELSNDDNDLELDGNEGEISDEDKVDEDEDKEDENNEVEEESNISDNIDNMDHGNNKNEAIEEGRGDDQEDILKEDCQSILMKYLNLMSIQTSPSTSLHFPLSLLSSLHSTLSFLSLPPSTSFVSTCSQLVYEVIQKVWNATFLPLFHYIDSTPSSITPSLTIIHAICQTLINIIQVIQVIGESEDDLEFTSTVALRVSYLLAEKMGDFRQASSVLKRVLIAMDGTFTDWVNFTIHKPRNNEDIQSLIHSSFSTQPIEDDIKRCDKRLGSNAFAGFGLFGSSSRLERWEQMVKDLYVDIFMLYCRYKLRNGVKEDERMNKHRKKMVYRMKKEKAIGNEKIDISDLGMEFDADHMLTNVEASLQMECRRNNYLRGLLMMEVARIRRDACPYPLPPLTEDGMDSVYDNEEYDEGIIEKIVDAVDKVKMSLEAASVSLIEATSREHEMLSIIHSSTLYKDNSLRVQTYNDSQEEVKSGNKGEVIIPPPLIISKSTSTIQIVPILPPLTFEDAIVLKDESQGNNAKSLLSERPSTSSLQQKLKKKHPLESAISCKIFGKTFGSGTSVSLNNFHLLGCHKSILISDLLAPTVSCDEKVVVTLSGLEPNTQYVFATAFYDKDGNLIGGSVGSSSPPVETLSPLPLPLLWCYLSQTAHELRNPSLSAEASSHVLHYLTSQSWRSEGVSLQHGVMSKPYFAYMMKPMVLDASPETSLYAFIRSIHILLTNEASISSSRNTTLESMRSINKDLLSTNFKEMDCLLRFRKGTLSVQIASYLRDDDVTITSCALTLNLIVPIISQWKRGFERYLYHDLTILSNALQSTDKLKWRDWTYQLHSRILFFLMYYGQILGEISAAKLASGLSNSNKEEEGEEEEEEKDHNIQIQSTSKDHCHIYSIWRNSILLSQNMEKDKEDNDVNKEGNVDIMPSFFNSNDLSQIDSIVGIMNCTIQNLYPIEKGEDNGNDSINVIPPPSLNDNSNDNDDDNEGEEEGDDINNHDEEIDNNMMISLPSISSIELKYQFNALFSKYSHQDVINIFLQSEEEISSLQSIFEGNSENNDEEERLKRDLDVMAHHLIKLKKTSILDWMSFISSLCLDLIWNQKYDQVLILLSNSFIPLSLLPPQVQFIFKKSPLFIQDIEVEESEEYLSMLMVLDDIENNDTFQFEGSSYSHDEGEGKSSLDNITKVQEGILQQVGFIEYLWGHANIQNHSHATLLCEINNKKDELCDHEGPLINLSQELEIDIEWESIVNTNNEEDGENENEKMSLTPNINSSYPPLLQDLMDNSFRCLISYNGCSSLCLSGLIEKSSVLWNFIQKYWLSPRIWGYFNKEESKISYKNYYKESSFHLNNSTIEQTQQEKLSQSLLIPGFGSFSNILDAHLIPFIIPIILSLIEKKNQYEKSMRDGSKEMKCEIHYLNSMNVVLKNGDSSSIIPQNEDDSNNGKSGIISQPQIGGWKGGNVKFDTSQIEDGDAKIDNQLSENNIQDESGEFISLSNQNSLYSNPIENLDYNEMLNLLLWCLRSLWCVNQWELIVSLGFQSIKIIPIEWCKSIFPLMKNAQSRILYSSLLKKEEKETILQVFKDDWKDQQARKRKKQLRVAREEKSDEELAFERERDGYLREVQEATAIWQVARHRFGMVEEREEALSGGMGIVLEGLKVIRVEIHEYFQLLSRLDNMKSEDDIHHHGVVTFDDSSNNHSINDFDDIEGGNSSLSSSQTGVTSPLEKLRKQISKKRKHIDHTFHKLTELGRMQGGSSQLLQVLQEYGDFLFYNGDIDQAGEVWFDVIDSLFQQVRVYEMGEEVLSPFQVSFDKSGSLSSSNFLEAYNIVDVLVVVCTIGKLIEHVIPNEWDKVSKLSKFSAELIKLTFSESISHPIRNVDFGAYFPSQYHKGISLFANPFRLSACNICHSLSIISKILIDEQRGVISFPMLCIGDYFSFRYMRDPLSTLQFRLLRVKACSQERLFAESFSLFSSVLSYANFPNNIKFNATNYGRRSNLQNIVSIESESESENKNNSNNISCEEEFKKLTDSVSTYLLESDEVISGKEGVSSNGLRFYGSYLMKQMFQIQKFSQISYMK